MNVAKVKLIFGFSNFFDKKSKNCRHNYETDGAKRGSTLFFTLCHKRGLDGGLCLFGGGVGAKRSRSRGGRVGEDAFDVVRLRDGDGCICQVDAERLQLHQFSPLHMNQSRRVRLGLHAAPCLGCCRSARCASGER